jgi:digeranylgeranylglycerophospholipid reductase
LHDVIVIGGGPVGSRVAGELAGRGYEVVVLEQKSSPGEGICWTGIVSLDCVRQFKIDESLILKKLAGAAAFSPSGKALRLRRAEDQAVVLNRLAFDRALAAGAERQGARSLFRTQERGLAVKPDRVSLEVLSSGEIQGIDSRAVVIATGANSRLIELLRLGRIGRRALGAQAEVLTPIPVEMEIYFGERVAPGYFAWLVPV